MLKIPFRLISTAAVLVFLVTSSFGQGLKNQWGWGIGFGANQLYSDNAVTPFGPGGNGLFTYRISDRFSLSLHAGYNVVKFKPSTNPTVTTTTDMVYGDLIGDFELTDKGIVRPFLMAGVGGFNFKNPADGKRYFDGEALVGGGFRVFFNPLAAFTLSGDARYTTGDDLDFPKNNNINDAYFAIRGGLTFYMGKRSTDFREDDLFTTVSDQIDQAGDDPLFIEGDETNALNSESGDYNDFLARLSALETGDTSNLSDRGKQDVKNVKMEEYLRLKSKLDELSSAIEGKESEITNLRENLPANGGQSGNYGSSSSFSSSGPIEITNFSNAYETALNRFYSRRYTDAIGIFEKLLERYPNHSLASNCEYWLGECFFNSGDYNRAIETFERVIQYPRSLKKDDALLMIGRSYMALNMNAKAQEAFNRLIREYPNSEFVVKSEQYLRKL